MHPIKPKLVRITTVPISLRLLLKGQMKHMKEQGFEVVMISSPGEDASIVEQQEGCEMITLPMERKVSLLADIQSLVRLKRILKNLEPDIVHTHTPKAGLLGMIAAKWAGVPIRLHTVAGLPWMESKGLSRFILKTMERITAFCAHRIYPNSKGLYDFLVREKVIFKKEKIKLLGNGSSNGIDCRHFSRAAVDEALVSSLRTKAQLQSGGWIWIFAGRLVREKGMHELLQAFVQIHAAYPNDQLWLLGEEEPERDPLMEADRKLMQSHPAIKCWGFQKDVRPYFAAADVLVFPSYREGLPNVPLQAGAMECALIVTDINGCNEIVEHNQSGLIVQPKSIESLVQAMKQLRVDTALKNKFAAAARERIEHLYSREHIWELIEGEYRNMMGKDR
ncbi:MAG: glycosyltransferase family 4 protein [Bacteroidetes bacterium]|nr:glycosyltransferase family 4 protein [Bacteroidota bacterium]